MAKKEYSESFYEEMYLVMADYSWEVFRNCKFDDYFVWGNYVRSYLRVGHAEPVKKYITQMANVSEKFFGFSQEELEMIAMRFFILEKYKDYYEHIRLFRKLHGGYIIKKPIKIY